jgi:hypothetical protein
MSGFPYASAIGSIMYAMVCTRPYTSYALSVSSRYQSDPGMAHWVTVKNILKYLRRIKNLLLVYGGNEELIVNGGIDDSFMTDIDDSKSQSGYAFTLNGGAVVWKSLKQNTLAVCMIEAEYILASEAMNEAVWIKKFIEEVGVVPNAMNVMALYCDNSGVVAQAKKPRSHMKTRHIKRKYHIIR